MGTRAKTLPAYLTPVLMGPILLAAGSAPAAAQGSYATSAPPAWLGISYEVRWTQAGGRCAPQVLVDGVIQGSPAERAGLRSGDAIIALNGESVPAGRIDLVATRLHPGDSIRLRVDRDGRVREVLAIADRRPARPPTVAATAKPGGLRATSAPIVHLDGETLVARNVEARQQDHRGYWFATDDGRTEYRRLGSWSQDDVDARVVRLLRCAEEVEWQPARAPVVDYRQVQRRADSLRVVITRRALEQADLEALHAPPPAPGLPHGAPGVLMLTESRGVAGADLAPLEPELAEYFRNAREGLLVLRVGRDTPAERAGLRPGDVIVEGNGRRLESTGELRALLSFPDPEPVRLRVVRKGRVRSITLERR